MALNGVILLFLFVLNGGIEPELLSFHVQARLPGRESRLEWLFHVTYAGSMA
jgi:hypothetical protein